MGLVTYHVIVEVDGGLLDQTPRLFDTEQRAGEYFQRIVTAKGFRFRDVGSGETWMEYLQAFWSWEDSPEVMYDKADWQISWEQDVPVNFDPRDYDEKVVIEEFNGLFNIYNEAGQAVEIDFEKYRDAELWATDNGYTVVNAFTLKENKQQRAHPY